MILPSYLPDTSLKAPHIKALNVIKINKEIKSCLVAEILRN